MYMFETIPFLGKKRDDPISSAVPWGSADIETGLKGLAPCAGGGCLCYVHDVLDLFKGNGTGGRKCLLHLHELHDSCLFSENSASKAAVEKQKETNSWFKFNPSYEGCHNVNLKKNQ